MLRSQRLRPVNARDFHEVSAVARGGQAPLPGLRLIPIAHHRPKARSEASFTASLLDGFTLRVIHPELARNDLRQLNKLEVATSMPPSLHGQKHKTIQI
jgi:hypothetical protein